MDESLAGADQGCRHHACGEWRPGSAVPRGISAVARLGSALFPYGRGGLRRSRADGVYAPLDSCVRLEMAARVVIVGPASGHRGGRVGAPIPGPPPAADRETAAQPCHLQVSRPGAALACLREGLRRAHGSAPSRPLCPARRCPPSNTAGPGAHSFPTWRRAGHWSGGLELQLLPSVRVVTLADAVGLLSKPFPGRGGSCAGRCSGTAPKLLTLPGARQTRSGRSPDPDRGRGGPKPSAKTRSTPMRMAFGLLGSGVGGRRPGLAPARGRSGAAPSLGGKGTAPLDDDGGLSEPSS